MKERPILFNGDMVRAILEGRKTQTRRVVKPQPVVSEAEAKVLSEAWDSGFINIACPYGHPGDRLWVRETFAIVPRTAYACSDGVQQVLRPDDNHDAAVFRAGWERSAPSRWRPSIHMPRWASRITLEIVSVRVERLNEISEQDAGDEGFDYLRGDGNSDISGDVQRRWFRQLWESINGAGSWEANPWVWVVEFKRVHP